MVAATPAVRNNPGSFSGVCLLVLLVMLMSGEHSTQGQDSSAQGYVVPIAADAETHLYGATTARREGKAASLDHLPKTMVIRYVGVGSITWEVDVARAGKYEVALCFAALTSTPTLEVRSAQSRITLEIHPTDGPYYPRKRSREGPGATDFLRNFERVTLEGTLYLDAGRSEITIAVTHPESGEAMDFRSMELTPVAAKKAIAASRERAMGLKASTDWMVKAKYGVMFHWTGNSQPRHGEKKPYAEAVRDFDVNAFADMVEETGAGFVIFTVNHVPPHCPAPIKAWEAVHPGWTTERDLIGDMAAALDKKNIKLILYIASHVIMSGDLIPEEESVEIHAKVLTEIGNRYGKKLAGFWFDGWDIIPQHFPRARISYEDFFSAAKAGNRDRVVGLNFWIFPDATPYQEFWAGEADEQLKPTRSRYMSYHAGQGLQRHALFMLEDIWVHNQRESEVPDPVFSQEELVTYVKNLTANDGVATINLAIYQDGTVGTKSLETMRALHRAIHD